MESLIEKIQEIHNYKYDYSLLVYKNCRTKISIICREHGIFHQNIHKHIIGHGNPKIYNPDDINRVVGKKFGFLYKKTIEKETYLKESGYNIISIWESEFNHI